eukprot:14991593-Ditylum_brightwellii.AAC.1
MGNIIRRSDVRSGPSGYERVLFNWEYADIMRNQNRVVFSQLSVASSGGTAYHLVKQHDEDKDGYAAWHSLIKWFDSDILKAETADTIMTRLESYKLGNGMTTSQYINNFLTAYRELNIIPGESISDSHALLMFLYSITDLSFATFVQIERNKNEGLEEAVLVQRKDD